MSAPTGRRLAPCTEQVCPAQAGRRDVAVPLGRGNPWRRGHLRRDGRKAVVFGGYENG
jgi:hypothetical protein